ncbi:uncharacterized protein LOC128806693 [Vidua macroura]|uniref:uncharacterized protein LOC128806693 n=1 Tax=Vidua macroura TaxID=187451 RepID=UPI0023A82F48|nr:uncharacterized protein LOC128806693 [Vidua macroura]
MESRAKNASSQTHRPLLSLDWMRQGTTIRSLGQPLPTGLEGLEAISSKQKVLQWLEVHVPSDPETLAKEDEDCENKIDKEQSHEILEEDITSPVPSDMWEDGSHSHESRDMSEVYSDQELFQREEDESTAAKGEAISKVQSTSPALAGSMDTKDEPSMFPTRASQQQGEAGRATPTSTGHAPSASSWKVPLVPGVQAGACLLPSQSPGDRSSLTASHATVQQQRQSLFRRALRAVCRAFLGTHRPREQEQQCPAPSARQVPGDGCSEPQQCPLRE